jgi:Rrf2 family protein
MLTKSTEYALRALIFIQVKNWEGHHPGVAEIAREIEAPLAFTAKILQTLTRHRLLDSARGRGGGFFFPEGKTELRLYDVIMVVEGDGLFYHCGLGMKNCNEEHPCPIHKQYAGIRDGFMDLVKKESIQSLAREIRKGRAVLKSINQ